MCKNLASLLMVEIGSLPLPNFSSDHVRSSMGIQPVEKRADPRGGQRDVMICCAVIDPQAISIRLHDVAAGKNDISHITHALIILICSEDPFIPADQAALRRFKIKEGEPQAVQRPGSSRTHTVIHHQPAARCFNGWITQAN